MKCIKILKDIEDGFSKLLSKLGLP